MAAPSMKLSAAGGGVAPSSAPPVAGYVAWYDFSDADSITIATGISQADDLSGNGFHLVQATGANQPTHTTSSLLGGSSLKVASFDGVDDWLGTASTTLTSGDYSWFCVAAKKTTTITGGNADVLIQLNGRPVYVTIAPNMQLWTGTAFPTLTTTSSVWTTAGQHTWIMSGSSQTTYRINATTLVDAAAGTTTSGALAVGATTTSGSHGDWEVGEIVVYDTALSTTNREAVESYLASKWGTP